MPGVLPGGRRLREVTEAGGTIRTPMYWCLHCERVYDTPAWLKVHDDRGGGELIHHVCVMADDCGGRGVGNDLYEWSPDDDLVPYIDGAKSGDPAPLRQLRAPTVGTEAQLSEVQPRRLNPPPIDSSLRSRLIGTWRLVSREDRNAAGERRVDPGLGADPLGLLIYDAGGNFAAQFMGRDRGETSQASAAAGSNNTSAVNGYDAYFGTYTVDEKTGTVTQSLSAALSPANVGMVVTRALKVEGDALVIELATTRPDGEPITRTLRWKRAS